MFISWRNTFLSTANRHDRRGFAKVEIITALMIVLLVTLTLGITFYFVFFKTRALRQENQTFNNAVFAMQIIAKDISETIVTPLPGFVPGLLTESGQHDKLRFWGRRASASDELSGENSFYRLTFSSLNSLKFENVYKNAPIQIVYYLDAETDADGGLILRRQANRLPYPLEFEPKASDSILIAGIQSMHIVYYDAKGNVFYDWDSENPHSGFGTPTMLEISVIAGLVSDPFALKTTVTLPCRRGASIFAELP